LFIYELDVDAHSYVCIYIYIYIYISNMQSSRGGMHNRYEHVYVYILAMYTDIHKHMDNVDEQTLIQRAKKDIA